MRRMLRPLDHEVLPARSAHREIEFAAGGEDSVAQRLGLEFAAVLAPEERVAGVDGFRRGIRGDGLTIRGA